MKHRLAVHQRGQQGEVSRRNCGAASRSGMEGGGPGCEPSAPVLSSTDQKSCESGAPAEAAPLSGFSVEEPGSEADA